MKKLLYLLIVLAFASSFARSQTTATDFTMTDCNGKMHHLFSELDSGNVIILEFFMLNCSSCIDAGKDLQAMYDDLKTTYDKKVAFYQFGYSNGYTCSSISNWVTNNGFSSVPFDSGGYQVAYYGGMGMPTVAVVAGSSHKVLFSNQGYFPGDTTTIGTAARSFLSGNGIPNFASSKFSFTLFPSLVHNRLNVALETTDTGILQLEFINITGQKIITWSEEKIQENTWARSIAIPDIPSGLYIVKGEFNGKTFMQKIVVQQ